MRSLSCILFACAIPAFAFSITAFTCSIGDSEKRFYDVVPIMRRYSLVSIARSRRATTGSQATSIERQRSIAWRRSRRKTTHDGQASMCALICSQVRGSIRLSRYSERLANNSRHSAGRLFDFERAFVMGLRLSAMYSSFCPLSVC